MPWVKGQSGNPKGGPRRRDTLPRLIREHTKQGLDLVEFAVEVFMGGHGAELKDRLDTMRWLADRGWGKAVETVVLEDEREVQATAIATENLESVVGGPEGFVQ